MPTTRSTARMTRASTQAASREASANASATSGGSAQARTIGKQAAAPPARGLAPKDVNHSAAAHAPTTADAKPTRAVAARPVRAVRAAPGPSRPPPTSRVALRQLPISAREANPAPAAPAASVPARGTKRARSPEKDASGIETSDPSAPRKRVRDSHASSSPFELLPPEDHPLLNVPEEPELPAVEPKPPKDLGWEDLDAEDASDPLMVSEYVHDIFAYMKKLEIRTMPNPEYIDSQDDISWEERGMLIDWLINIHNKFHLVPETFFLAVNLIDRLLSMRLVALSKLQLVGVTALFTAAKYEEVMVPSVANFVYVCKNAVDEAEMLSAERYLLRTLQFDFSFPNPMNFLRRISKADDYDIQTRTVAKYLIEIAAVDYRFLSHPPSVIAAAGLWLAREVLQRGEWDPTLVHYSGYTAEELLTTAELMIDYVLRPPLHPCLHRKYASKKFMKASLYVQNWAHNLWPEIAEMYSHQSRSQSPGSGSPREAGAQRDPKGRLVPETPAIDLFDFYALDRPSQAELEEIFGITQALRDAAPSSSSQVSSPRPSLSADQQVRTHGRPAPSGSLPDRARQDEEESGDEL